MSDGSVLLRCSCGCAFEIPPELAGADVLCPTCRRAVTPHPAALPPPVYGQVVQAAPATRRLGAVRARRRPPPYLKWAIAGGVALLALGALRVVLPSGAPPKQIREKSLPPHVETTLREMERMEEDAEGKPEAYEPVLERWKALERQYRRTSHQPLFAEGAARFEERLNATAAAAADRLLRGADVLVEAGRHPDALRSLRDFPAAFAGTEAGRRVAARLREIDDEMDRRYRAGKETCLASIAGEKFREAQTGLEALRQFVTFEGPEGLQYARAPYAAEIETLSRRIEDEYVTARRRREEARAAGNAPTPDLPESPLPRRGPPTPGPLPLEVPRLRTAPERLPEPDDAARKAAGQEIRNLFRDDYAKRAPGDRLALARELLGLAKKEEGNPASRYVLLQEAADLAAQAGDYDLALSAVREMSRFYLIDEPARRDALLEEAARGARTAEDCRSLAGLFLKLGEEAKAAEDFEEAGRKVAQAESLARRAREAALLARIQASAREIAEMKPRHEKAQKALERLSSNPGDGWAHLAVGQYLCLCKDDWDSGLLHLARGSDPSYRAAAAKDLARPAEAAERAKAGDGWWDLGEREAGHARLALRRRALVWYERALPDLPAAARPRVERRISEARLGPP